MKKIVWINLCVCLLLTLCSCDRQIPKERNSTSQITDKKEQSNPIRYTLSDDGVLDVMGEGEVPAEIFPFTTDEGDEGNYDVQKIVVHEGITGLGKKCFANFYSAEAVILPEGLKKIGAHAFDGCVSLKQIRLPDTVEEIGAYAFRDCVSLQELTLPPSLERYPVNAMKQCSALKKVKNCSSRTWKLCSGKSLHGTWYGGGSKVDSIKPGQTVKLISDEYKITYDLNGGIAKGKLPETYSYGDGIKLPDTVERKGYQLVGWEDLADDAGGELTWCIACQTKGNRRVRAVWLDFRVEDLGKGKIRAFWNISPYYECLIRYSRNEDMSDYKFVNKFYVQSVTVSKLEKGKRYYIEYAVIDDMDDFETLDDLPWSGKMSIVAR